ncbi:MAG: hypothetical protein EOO75_14755 [Myxococcales bacterium]|nr:MAG: hypothetical protein EOO75_14755 [Myxococcales bacterium]
MRLQRAPLESRQWAPLLDRRLLYLSHQGDPDQPGPVQCFAVADRSPVLATLDRHRLDGRLPGDREAFEQGVAESWWRAGLGLLSGPTRASLPGPFSTSPGHESYRGQGVEPPDFGLLRARLRGVEGEGLAQLPWLFAPASALLRPPSFPVVPPIMIPGRPLRVGPGRRQSEARRRSDWG